MKFSFFCFSSFASVEGLFDFLFKETNTVLPLSTQDDAAQVQFDLESITLSSAECSLTIPLPQGYPLTAPQLETQLSHISPCMDPTREEDAELARMSMDPPKLFDLPTGPRKPLLRRMFARTPKPLANFGTYPFGPAEFSENTLTCFSHAIPEPALAAAMSAHGELWNEDIKFLENLVLEWGSLARHTERRALGAYHVLPSKGNKSPLKTSLSFRALWNKLWRNPTVDADVAEIFCSVLLQRVLEVYKLVFQNRWAAEGEFVLSKEFIDHVLFSPSFLLLPTDVRAGVESIRKSNLGKATEALAGTLEVETVIGALQARSTQADIFAAELAKLFALGKWEEAGAKLQEALVTPLKIMTETTGEIYVRNYEELSKRLGYQTVWNDDTKEYDIFEWNPVTKEYDTIPLKKRG